MSKNLVDLYYENLAIAHERQSKLVDLIGGEETYTVDFKDKELKFGSDLAFKFVVLGSESFEENSWLWGWANENLNLNDQDQKKSQSFKKFGEESQIDSFMQPMLQLGGDWSANEIALISLGISNFVAYYRYPHEYGAFYLMLEQNENLSLGNEVDLTNVNSIFTDCWSLYDDGNHIDILKFYLERKGVPFKVSGSVLQAEYGAQTIECEYDESGHVGRCRVKV